MIHCTVGGGGGGGRGKEEEVYGGRGGTLQCHSLVFSLIFCYILSGGWDIHVHVFTHVVTHTNVHVQCTCTSIYLAIVCDITSLVVKRVEDKMSLILCDTVAV